MDQLLNIPQVMKNLYVKGNLDFKGKSQTINVNVTQIVEIDNHNKIYHYQSFM